ncbi:Clp protease N-terminal domain-containing protein [Rhodococcus triatomae]|nr:putative Clp protease subunit Probable ATP-dependent Clp protease ATP-binding subunit [Rhodococcus triatomae BKS 15-14]
MFERFTDEARAAVLAAQSEARDRSAARIEPAHVLLGVLAAGSDTALGRMCVERGLTVEAVRADLADEPLGEQDAEALRSIGIDLDAVRESVEANFGADAFDGAVLGGTADDRRGWFSRRTGHLPFTAGAKKVLELALREAIARKDKSIRADHLVLGLVRGGDPAVAAVIGRHLPPAELRGVVVDLLDRAA